MSTHDTRSYRRLALTWALAFSLLIIWFLFRLPFEVSDNLGNLIQLEEATSAVALFNGTAGLPGFMRPLSWASTKVLYDLAGDRTFLTYKTFHALQILALMGLFVSLLSVRNRADLLLVPLASFALVGVHTFHETVRETEFNIKLLIPIICLAAVALAASGYRRWHDVAAVVLFGYGVFANELGLLVWVALVAAHLAGWRGVSRWALGACTALMLWYFYLRFGPLAVGTPGLSERSSGFGFYSRSPAELVAMFGDNPLPFYLYNVVCSAMTVLFSEPRGGGFVTIREIILRRTTLWLLINVITSTIGTGLVVRYAWRRRGSWLRWNLTHHDRLVFVAVGVLAANAVISYPYAKDVTMSTAGVFWALALFAAVRELLTWVSRSEIPLRSAITVATILITLAAGWTVRAGAFFQDLRLASYKAQYEWLLVYDWLESQNIALETEGQRELVRRLRAQMLAMSTAKPYQETSWLEQIDPFH